MAAAAGEQTKGVRRPLRPCARRTSCTRAHMAWQGAKCKCGACLCHPWNAWVCCTRTWRQGSAARSARLMHSTGKANPTQCERPGKSTLFRPAHCTSVPPGTCHVNMSQGIGSGRLLATCQSPKMRAGVRAFDCVATRVYVCVRCTYVSQAQPGLAPCVRHLCPFGSLQDAAAVLLR